MYMQTDVWSSIFYCISFAHLLGWSFYLTLGEYKRDEFSTISLPYRGKLTSPLKCVGFSSGIELLTSGRIYASQIVLGIPHQKGLYPDTIRDSIVVYLFMRLSWVTTHKAIQDVTNLDTSCLSEPGALWDFLPPLDKDFRSCKIIIQIRIRTPLIIGFTHAITMELKLQFKLRFELCHVKSMLEAVLSNWQMSPQQEIKWI